MRKKVLLFEDNPEHQNRLTTELERVGCEVLAISHANAEEELERICAFDPDTAVVDSVFDNDYDGVTILNFLNKHFPKMPTVVCTILLAEDDTRDRAYRTYRPAPNVRAVLGKEPLPGGGYRLPSGEDIIAACGL